MTDWKQWMGMGLLAMLVCSSAWASPNLKSHYRESPLVINFNQDNDLPNCLMVLGWHLERMEQMNAGYPDPALRHDSEAGILWSDRPLLTPTRMQRLFD